MMNVSVSKKPKLLVVDDREDNLLSIEAILKKDNYEFTMAFSGSEALKILNKDPDFAMILMDVKMPVLSGFETATLIYEREKLKHIPIIFITANYYGEENLFKGYQSGGIDYIFKPINPEVLRAKVSIFIDLYRKNRLLVEQDEKLLEINKNLAFEIKNLRTAEECLTQINCNLRKKIADLEAIMAVSDIPIERSEFVTSDLNALVEGLINDMGDEAKTATISVEKLPSLCISPRLMRPLFKNLISNALLYRRKNIKPTITIRSEMAQSANGESAHEQGEKYWQIFVEDNCNGFYQNLSGEINGEFCDTELGLAFYQKIMDHHKGFISAKNKVNEGLTYILSLPVNIS